MQIIVSGASGDGARANGVYSFANKQVNNARLANYNLQYVT